jgi:AcrR family transcriptional regulator
MADILAVATREFAEKGLAGARIDDIAEAMRTSKRMIYYYFGSKEGCTSACWKRPTGACAASRPTCTWTTCQPEDALRRLVGFTVDYQLAHPEFIRLVMTENIHRGEYLAQSRHPAAERAGHRRAAQCLRARREGRACSAPGIDPVDLHMSISALSVFNVANRHTFSLIFQRDLDDPRAVGARRDSIVEMVVRAHATWGASGVDLSTVATLLWDDGRRAQLSCAMDGGFHRHAQVVGSDGVLQTEFMNHTHHSEQGHPWGFRPSLLRLRRGAANRADWEQPPCGTGSGFRFAAEAFARLVATRDHAAAQRAAQASLDIAATLQAIAASARSGRVTAV